MVLKFTNNAATTLSSNVSTTATTVSVVDASDFPSISVGEYTYITMATPDSSKIEIVRVTLLNSNTFTVLRGQDNTTAQAFSVGDLCELRITAGLIKDVATNANDAAATATTKAGEA
jgi:hypothetical protein